MVVGHPLSNCPLNFIAAPPFWKKLHVVWMNTFRVRISKTSFKLAFVKIKFLEEYLLLLSVKSHRVVVGARSPDFLHCRGSRGKEEILHCDERLQHCRARNYVIKFNRWKEETTTTTTGDTPKEAACQSMS